MFKHFDSKYSLSIVYTVLLAAGLFAAEKRPRRDRNLVLALVVFYSNFYSISTC